MAQDQSLTAKLEMKPECERCSRDLAQDTNEAYICSYECTFCRVCAEEHLQFVCPNCGGNLVVRPARATDPRDQNSR